MAWPIGGGLGDGDERGKNPVPMHSKERGAAPSGVLDGDKRAAAPDGGGDGRDAGMRH